MCLEQYADLISRILSFPFQEEGGNSGQIYQHFALVCITFDDSVLAQSLELGFALQRKTFCAGK